MSNFVAFEPGVGMGVIGTMALSSIRATSIEWHRWLGRAVHPRPSCSPISKVRRFCHGRSRRRRTSPWGGELSERPISASSTLAGWWEGMSAMASSPSSRPGLRLGAIGCDGRYWSRASAQGRDGRCGEAVRARFGRFGDALRTALGLDPPHREHHQCCAVRGHCAWRRGRPDRAHRGVRNRRTNTGLEGLGGATGRPGCRQAGDWIASARPTHSCQTCQRPRTKHEEMPHPSRSASSDHSAQVASDV